MVTGATSSAWLCVLLTLPVLTPFAEGVNYYYYYYYYYVPAAPAAPLAAAPGALAVATQPFYYSTPMYCYTTIYQYVCPQTTCLYSLTRSSCCMLQSATIYGTLQTCYCQSSTCSAVVPVSTTIPTTPTTAATTATTATTTTTPTTITTATTATTTTPTTATTPTTTS